MSESVITLEIPVEEDIPIVREMLQEAYETVGREYETQTDASADVMRKGSLCMELSAQINNQRPDDAKPLVLEANSRNNDK